MNSHTFIVSFVRKLSHSPVIRHPHLHHSLSQGKHNLTRYSYSTVTVQLQYSKKGEKSLQLFYPIRNLVITSILIQSDNFSS